MKMKLLFIFISLILVTGCGKVDQDLVTEELNDLKQMQAMRSSPNSADLVQFCLQNGGYYEMWADGEVFCMLGSYGCDPREYYFGRCGIGI